MVENLLRGKNLLFLTMKSYVASEEDITTSTFCRLKNDYGASSVYVVMVSGTENNIWSRRLKDDGYIDDFNVSILEGLLIGKVLNREKCTLRIVDWVRSKGVQIDGCVCKSDRLMQLRADVCEELDLPTDGGDAVQNAILKDVTQSLVLSREESREYGVETFAVGTKDELEVVLEQLPFPIVMKPVAGTGSATVKRIETIEESEAFLKSIKPDINPGGSLHFKFGHVSKKVAVMKYLTGTQYAVDVIICQGSLVGGVVIERGRPTMPSCQGTFLSMPGNTSSGERDILIKAAYNCCTAVGLKNGVYDVDFIWKQGEPPKLIEINPRCGGYATLVCALEIYGIDLFLIDSILACNVKIEDLRLEPRGHCVGYLVFPDRDGERLERAWQKICEQQVSSPDRNLKIQRFVTMTIEQAIELRWRLYNPICAILYHGESYEKAKSTLASLLLDVEFFLTEDNLSQFFNSHEANSLHDVR